MVAGHLLSGTDLKVGGATTLSSRCGVRRPKAKGVDFLCGTEKKGMAMEWCKRNVPLFALNRR